MAITNEELENYRKTEMEEVEQIFKDMKEEEENHKKYEAQKEAQQKAELKAYKLKQRKFKVFMAKAALTTALASGLFVLAHKPWQNKTEKLIDQLTMEADIHGGAISPDGKKLYNLEEHVESGYCLIQGDGTVQDRFRCVCEENDIPDSVTDSIVVRFEENYNNNFDNAKKIKPLKIYKQEQSEINTQEVTYK